VRSSSIVTAAKAAVAVTETAETAGATQRSGKKRARKTKHQIQSTNQMVVWHGMAWHCDVSNSQIQ